MIEWLGNLFSSQILETALSLVSLAVIALLGFITRWVAGKIDTIKNENWQRLLMFAMQEGHNAAREAVTVVEETIVKVYKEEGEWNEKTMKKAKKIALKKMKGLMTDWAISILGKFMGSFDDWAGDIIETKNLELKKSQISNLTFPNQPQ